MPRLSMKPLLKHATLPALVLLTGCAVGPNFHQPAAPAGAGYTPTRLTGTHKAAGPLGAAQTFVPAQDIPGQWWTLFHSPDLNQLIKQALQANPSIAAAQAALRVSQEDLLAQDGSFFPQIGASIGASKNLTSTASLAPVGAFNKAFYSLYTAQLSISYSPDVFGLNRRMVESLAAQAENKRDELEAADLSLSANVVTAAFQEAGLRAAIAAQQQTIKADQDLETIIARQYADGEVAQSVLLQQQTALAQAQQLLPPLQRQLDMQENALIALSGGYPNEMLPETFDLSQLHLPQTLPVSLPSQLVAQRPDILAAAANMHAASAEIGVAIANRLPQLPLTAQLGTSPAAIANAFTPYNQFYTLAAGLTGPLFNGGALVHKQRAAVAQFDEAAAMYKQTVINAFQNVSDTLRALQTDADQLQAAQTADNDARQSLAIARTQFQDGTIAYVTVLNAEQMYQAAQLALVQAEVMRLTDTAALFQALGGGWWNRDGPAAANI
ncbi:MAG TPA: efflux transporter outer membrane subunit [Acidocella sp.]|uniref:efflux transporter outer membrane subunit n=1 Tax=Acidocella sp. TaxID=50710 RepID=UPI002BCCB223|nr:efflux transporter outer membrane subunit [Acidocella sp.]HVE23593.1 efflux transporter outer membrane subunit [Acidocella sp.]